MAGAFECRQCHPTKPEIIGDAVEVRPTVQGHHSPIMYRLRTMTRPRRSRFGGGMSGGMSTLVRIPDSSRTSRHVRKVPFSDFDVETSHGTARRHIDAVCVVPNGASDGSHGCQDNRMVSTRRMPACPLIAGA
jgi:hypothetical protein